MPEISLSNSKGRDATVTAESVRVPLRVRWVDQDDRQSTSVRILKGGIDRDFEALAAAHGGPDKVADALIAGDPEVDLETYGSFLRGGETARVYINSERQIVYAVRQEEIVRNPDGTEKLRRPKVRAVPNVKPDQPLKWSGKLLSKSEVFNKFVMVAKQQVKHVNGLTYDFLYEIARELEQRDSLLLVGAGPKGNQPLILRTGSTPYRGFLEGRTQGDKYCLLLHLSNIELKAPEAQAAGGEASA